MRHLPQLILLALLLLRLGVSFRRVRYPKPHGFKVLVSVAFTGGVLALLWWGGFFDRLLGG